MLEDLQQDVPNINEQTQSKMTEQYYIPSLEDFRSGFEFELLYREIEKWNKEIFNAPIGHSFCCTVKLEAALKDRLWSTSIRVPYLSDEQIEAEGYKTHGDDEGNYVFGDYPSSDPRYTFCYYPSEKRLLVSKEVKGKPSYTALFDGTCRCINDFRLICKLLNIK